MNKKVILTFGIATLSCGLASSALVAADDTRFTVTVNPYLNVTLSDSDIHLPITPTSAGTYGDTYFTATASTNNAYGYKLNLSIKDGSAANANLTTDLKSNVTNVNTGVAPVIPTFSTNDVLTSSEFSASTSTDHINHWAMSINDTDHYKKVLSESTIATSDSPAIDDPTTINLATKLDLLTSPGSYSAYFNFAVVANPVPPESNPINEAMGNAGKQPVMINNKLYYKMQDMTDAICGAVTTPTAANNNDTPEAQLVDIRDGKIYWVAKLEDGNCWMTQNLDHDIVTDGSVTYNSTTTDLPTGVTWTPERGTYASNVTHWNDYDANTNPDGVNGYLHPESYDPGDLYWNGVVVNDSDDDDATASSGDSHYHLGNYYNSIAAIAVNDIDTLYPSDITPDDDGYAWVDSDRINQSICPAGWKLPQGLKPGVWTNPPDKSIFRLASFYGWDENNTHVVNPNIWERSIKLPLTGSYRGGDEKLGAGSLGWFHDTTFVVSHTYHQFAEAYGTFIDSYDDWVSVNDQGPLDTGRSIRCVAR